MVERSGSVMPGGLEELLSPVFTAEFSASEFVVSGDADMGWVGFKGGTGNGALPIREAGERFCAGDALALALGESGL